MTSLEDVIEAFKEGRRQYEEIITKSKLPGFDVIEKYGQDRDKTEICNRIVSGDNLAYMANLIKNENMAGKVQLIYVDPPFFSKGKYHASVRIKSDKIGDSNLIKAEAYDDCWNQELSQYITMLTTRLYLMRDLLSDEGCLWVHLDWHVVHYVKIILDSIFGEKNFINEIIWTYKSGGANKRSFAKKHDNLLVYGKTKKYYFNRLKEKSYNRGYKPYRFKGVEEFEDEIGWYTMVNMKDVWHIDMVGRTSSERTGYATQKPEKLLERIIESCSREGDICADFFSGSGTLGSVCDKLKRKWIMCDAAKISVSYQISRMGLQDTEFMIEHMNDAYKTYESEKIFKGHLKVKIDNDEIILQDYNIDDCHFAEPLGTDGKGNQEIRKYLQEDSLSLIKCWSVDFDYDGKIHCADKIMNENERTCSVDAWNGKSDISVAGYDVLGNRFFYRYFKETV